MHTAALIEEVLQRLQDPAGNRIGFFRVGKLIAEAQRFMLGATATVLRARAYLSSDPTITPLGVDGQDGELAANIAANVAHYLLPSDFHLIQEIKLDSSTGALSPISLEQARGMNVDWESETGTPQHWLHGYWGTNRIRLYPYPTQAATPLLYYHRRPADPLTRQEPELDAFFHDALTHYVTWRALVEDDALRDGERAAHFRELFDATFAQFKEHAPKNRLQRPRRARTDFC